MNIISFRIVAFLLLGWIIYSEAWMLLLYIIVFTGFVEYLNSRWEYKSKKFKLINFFFMLFLAGETIIRTINYTASKKVRYLINSFEHFLFALLICFIVYMVLDLSFYFRKISFKNKLIISAISFNIIGFFNEIYQNFAQQVPIFPFHKGSYIDLFVNLFGSVVFIGLGYLYNWYRNNQLQYIRS